MRSATAPTRPPLPDGSATAHHHPGHGRSSQTSARLIADQLTRDPDTVVECGLGTTTLLIGGFLRRNGRGRLFSLEHDSRFAESTQRQVDAAGLSDVCQVIYRCRSSRRRSVTRSWAGTTSTAWAGCRRRSTYSSSTAHRPRGPGRAGPRSACSATACAPNASILVDDGRRREERRMVFRWLASAS